jgi:hypothetical protein
MGKVFDIPNIHDSIKTDFESGKITLKEAALELHKAGWTNHINLEYARKVLN